MCVPAFLVFFRSILNWSLEPKHPMLTHYHVFSSPANDFYGSSDISSDTAVMQCIES